MGTVWCTSAGEMASRTFFDPINNLVSQGKHVADRINDASGEQTQKED